MSNNITVLVGSIAVGVVLGLLNLPILLGIALAGGLYLLAIGDS